MEEIRVISIKELKKEIDAELEYAHPDRSVEAVNALVIHGFLPCVDGKLFHSEKEAVVYTLQTDEAYKDIRDLEDGAKVLESYDEEKDLLHYKFYDKKFFTIELSIGKIYYHFIFEEDEFSITNTNNYKVSTCKDLEWSENEEGVNIFFNDDIIYPANIKSMLEALFISWKKDELKDSELEDELKLLINWINAMTINKPRTPFWNRFL